MVRAWVADLVRSGSLPCHVMKKVVALRIHEGSASECRMAVAGLMKVLFCTFAWPQSLVSGTASHVLHESLLGFLC